jgi:hypothetical protein
VTKTFDFTRLIRIVYRDVRSASWQPSKEKVHGKKQKLKWHALSECNAVDLRGKRQKECRPCRHHSFPSLQA